MSQQIHLILDGKSPATKAGDVKALLVPAGVSSVVLSDADEPQLTPGREAPHAGFLIEPVQHGHQPYLVLINPNGQARINGLPAPQLAILGEKDCLQLEDRAALHVSLYRQPQIGPPGDEFTGKQCPVCLGTLKADTTVYVCSGCRSAIHLEGPEKPESERLECLRLSSSCPVCSAAVVLEKGYSYIPESEHE